MLGLLQKDEQEHLSDLAHSITTVMGYDSSVKDVHRGLHQANFVRKKMFNRASEASTLKRAAVISERFSQRECQLH